MHHIRTIPITASLEFLFRGSSSEISAPKFLYTPHVLNVFTPFTAQKFLIILQNTLKSEFLDNNLVNVVQLDKRRQPILASLEFLSRGFKQ